MDLWSGNYAQPSSKPSAIKELHLWVFINVINTSSSSVSFFSQICLCSTKKKVSKMPCAVLFITLNNKKLHAIQCEETTTLSLSHTIQERKFLPYTFDATFYNPNASSYSILSSLFCICDNIWVTAVLFPKGKEIEKQIFKKNENNNIKMSE